MRLADTASPHPRPPFLLGASETGGSASLQLSCAFQERCAQHTHFCLSYVRTSVGVLKWITVKMSLSDMQRYIKALAKVQN